MAQVSAHRAPKYLYHYQPFVPKYLVTMLENGQVKLAQPGLLNDPWDCHPIFRAPCTKEEEERLIAYSLTGTRNKRKKAALENISRYQNVRKNHITKMSEALSAASNKIYAEVCKRFAFYSFSAANDHPLMWAHYASSHEGVCLQFLYSEILRDGDSQESLKQVEYFEDYAVPVVPDEPADLLRRKASLWSYENEYRLIYTRNHKERQNYTAPLLINLPKESLLAVIAGCRMSDETFAELREMISRLRPDVAIKRAQKLSDRLGLKIV